DALRGLGAQVVHALLGLHRAEEGLEHHVELARRRVLAAGAAVRARDVGQVVFRRLLAGPLGVLLELDAQGPVVPRRPRAAVDLAGGEDEPAALAQRDNRFDLGGRVVAGHGRHSTTVGRRKHRAYPVILNGLGTAAPRATSGA